MAKADLTIEITCQDMQVKLFLIFIFDVLIDKT